MPIDDPSDAIDYEVYNKKYELGMSNYSDYLERLNALDLAAREYEKAKNELASFTYKIDRKSVV